MIKYLSKTALREDNKVSIKANSRQMDGVTIVDLSGRITLGEGTSTLREALRDLVGRGQKRILLNLADVNYIDSSGIGELVSGYTTLTGQGGQLKLLNLTKKVHDLLQITKLITVFEFYQDEATAIKVSAKGPGVAGLLSGNAWRGQWARAARNVPLSRTALSNRIRRMQTSEAGAPFGAACRHGEPQPSSPGSRADVRRQVPALRLSLPALRRSYVFP